MSGLILPNRFTSQPQYPAGIDWSNPLTRGLLGAISASSKDGTIVGAPAFEVSSAGVALKTNGSTLISKTVASPISSATLLIVGNAVNSANTNVFLSSFGTNSGGNQTFLIQPPSSSNSSPLRALIRVANGGGISTRESATYVSNIDSIIDDHVFAAVYYGTSSLDLYLDGKLDNGTTANTAASGNVTALDNIALGGIKRGTNGYSTGIRQHLALGFNRALSASEIKSLSDNPWQIFKSQSRRIWVAAAGGDVTLPLGFVTETDSANSITSAKSRAIGQVSESDSVIGIGASKSVTLGLTVETNQAQAIALAKSAGLGITTETDTSFALLRSKLATIGQPIEADSANAVARSKTVTLGIVVETDSAPSLGAGISIAIGQVVESDTAQAISKAKSKALSQVVESDSVPSIAATKTLALGLVTEIDTPLALAQASGITLGLVTESDTAPAISVTKVKVLGQVTEANTVSGIAKAKSATIGQVIEADTANPLVGNLVAVLGLVTEIEFAHSISLLKSRGLLQVTEADSVFGLTKDKVVYISQVVEVDQVFSVFSKIDYRFVESGYNTLSIDPAYNKMYIDPNYH